MIKQQQVLILAFYDFLGKNQPKDVALNKAREAYLNTAIDEAYAHPYYWAAAVPIGNMEPVELPSKSLLDRYSLYLALGIISLLLIGVYFGLLRRNPKRKQLI